MPGYRAIGRLKYYRTIEVIDLKKSERVRDLL